MGIATQTVKLDISRTESWNQTVRLGQGDRNATTLVAHIYDKGEPFAIGSYSVRFSMMLPDGEHYYSVNGSASGNTATFNIDERYAASVKGLTEVAYVELLSGSTVVASTSRVDVLVLQSATDALEAPESWSSAIAEAEAEMQRIVSGGVATRALNGLMSAADKRKLDDMGNPVYVSKGGTGRSTITSGSYLVGNGTAAVALKTPAEVLSDIGAQSAAFSQVACTADTSWISNATAENFFVVKSGKTGYLRGGGVQLAQALPVNTNCTVGTLPADYIPYVPAQGLCCAFGSLGTIVGTCSIDTSGNVVLRNLSGSVVASGTKLYLSVVYITA